jgi:hypothetical protein
MCVVCSLAEAKISGTCLASAAQLDYVVGEFFLPSSFLALGAFERLFKNGQVKQ